MENLGQKIPFIQCAGLMYVLLSLPVISCLSSQHVHTKVAHCPKAVVLSLSQRHLQFYIALCLPTPHFMNNIKMRVMRTMGFVEHCPADEPGWVNALWPGEKRKGRCVRRGYSHCVRDSGCVSGSLSLLYVNAQDVNAKQSLLRKRLHEVHLTLFMV